jgi:hypothetical protein
MSVDLSEDIRLLIAAQSEAIARWQAPTVGLDTTVIDAQPRLGRWQPLYRGVYAAFTGPPRGRASCGALCSEPGPVSAWLISACARRRATPVALQAIQARPRIRWRAALAGALEDIGNGIRSVLEYRYARAVERPHGLPAARPQARVPRGSRPHYFDNLYADFGVAVELDGRAAHRPEDRWADTPRDNFFAGVGIVTLRYGWADVTERPCQVAAEVGQVLRERGWTGTVSRCGLACGC